MAKKIVKVEDKKKSGKVDLNKIKDVIIDNKDTIAKIVTIAGDLLDDDNKKKTTKKSSATKSSKTKKTTKSKKSDLDTVLDLAGKFLK